MSSVPADLVWEPGQITVLDERLTDVESYERHEEKRLREWLALVELVEGAA